MSRRNNDIGADYLHVFDAVCCTHTAMHSLTGRLAVQNVTGGSRLGEGVS